MYTVHDRIYMGVQGEALARTLQIDISELTTPYPTAAIALYVQRPIDSVPYQAAHASASGSVLTFEPDATDMSVAGKVQLQISAISGGSTMKTIIAYGYVDESLSGNVSPEPPDAIQAWIDTLQDDAAYAEKLKNVTASATTLQPGTSATVAISQTSDTTSFTFGLPRGQDGGGLASVNGKSTPNVTLYGSDIDLTDSESITLDAAIAGKVDEPATEGTSGQVLTTDGAGGRSWTTVQGGGGAVSSVNGKTGAVVLNNTDVGAAATSHTHAQSDITDLATDLAAKEDAGYITVGGDQYQIRIGTEGAAGYLTLVLES